MRRDVDVTQQPEITADIEKKKQTVVQEDLLAAVKRAAEAILADQREDGHWCYELEADSTIPAEYILMMHYMDEVDPEVEHKLAKYLRARQSDHGGWPLYHGGEFDMSCSVKAYYALKLVGDDVMAEHMVSARAAILEHGGAARSNVFTRITLALFEQVPWRAVPFIPVEVMLLPKWFPFHISKVSYWSRTVMVPLFILCSLRGRAKNPQQVHIRELFTVPPEQEKNYFDIRSSLNRVFLAFDSLGKMIEPLIPKKLRKHAAKKAGDWYIERLNGEDGLGAIFPAMVNAFEALPLLGYEDNHPNMKMARSALKNLLVINEDDGYCQPCLSPIWDTGLAALALQEANNGDYSAAIDKSLDWLLEKQITEVRGDWTEDKPDLISGGWAFQYNNDYYPDLDDTAVIAWAMHQAQHPDRYDKSINIAVEWLTGMQSANGGFAAFDVDNTFYYLNEIPFADHGALLDPPTADVSARVCTMYGKLQRPQDKEAASRCLEYLYKEQESDGSWFGRWGTNYIYGTWSVLMAMEAMGQSTANPRIQHAAKFLIEQQREDGGWCEDNGSYFDPPLGEDNRQSTSFQTAWALLGLMAAGEVDHPAVERGIHFLMSTQEDHGLWSEPWFTCPGFPRVFYLKYHGYSKIFPLWALARYLNLKHGKTV